MLGSLKLDLKMTERCNLGRTGVVDGAVGLDMPIEYALKAVDLALASIREGGELQVAFGGGEPLLRAREVARVMLHAWKHAGNQGVRTRFDLASNGTVVTGLAWDLICDPRLNLRIRLNGLPHGHDVARKWPHGQARAMETIWRLVADCRPFEVSVRCSESERRLNEVLRLLHANGVRDISLDHENLETVCLRHKSANHIAGRYAVRGTDQARCEAHVVVAASGRLYSLQSGPSQGHVVDVDDLSAFVTYIASKLPAAG